MINYIKKIVLFCTIVIFIQVISLDYAYAATTLPIPDELLGITRDGEVVAVSTSLQLLLLLSVISLAPSLLVTMTSFTRIIIIFFFTRSALSTQQMPPNQVLISLALFMTMYLMGPIFTEINETALKPLGEGQISQSEALERAMEPVRDFMIAQADPKDISLFASLTGEVYSEENPIPNRVIIPAFIMGEITKGFLAGFIIYIPFIVIDMIVATILMAMGMMMLPPAMISLPFKILLFIMIDGWSLIIESTIRTF